MVTNINSLNAYSYSSFIAGGNSNKLYVPVNPTAVMYSQFDHVSGIATHNGEQGVPISKIEILNTLIDQLVEMKIKTPVESDIKTSLNPDQIDALIKNYQAQIKSTVQAATAVQYGLAGIKPQTGIIFNIEI